MTLGQRNNNPLNIRYSKQNNWLGQIGSNKGFCVFDNIEHGYRAAIMLVRNYVRKGFNTPRKIITRFAPSNENDTQAYIKNCRYPWSPDYQLSSISDICVLLAGMAYIESRVEVLPLDLVHIANDYKLKF